MSLQNVSISLLSRLEDGASTALTEQTHEGTLAEKNGSAYLRYAEPDGTKTTICLTSDEVRLYRRGEMSSWQVFQLGEITGGLLTLGGNEMVLRVMTSHFSVEQEAASGQLQLHYELWAEDADAPDPELQKVPMGRFSLDVSWEVREGLAPEPAARP